MKPKICIIIPSFNLAEKLNKCLLAILKTGYTNIAVIIYDNGSASPLEKQFEKYKIRLKELIFLRSGENVGFARANNEALKFGLNKYPETDYFLLLNNDAYINKDFFPKSLPYLEKKYEMLSPIIMLSGNREIDSMGINYYSDGTTLNRNKLTKNNYLLPAACLFISRTFVKECFDKFCWLFIPMFHLYAEDVELSLRAILMGKKLQLISHEIVTHDKSASSKSEESDLYLGVRNLLWTIIITWTDKMIWTNIFQILRGQWINIIVYTLKFKNLFILKIYLSTLLHSSRLFKIRKLIQTNLVSKYPSSLLLKNHATLIDHILRSKTMTNVNAMLMRLYER